MSDKPVDEKTKLIEVTPTNMRQLVDMISPAMMPMLGDLLKEKHDASKSAVDKEATERLTKSLSGAAELVRRGMTRTAEMLVKFDQLTWQEARVDLKNAEVHGAYVGSTDGWRLEVVAARKPSEKEVSFVAYLVDTHAEGIVSLLEDYFAKTLIGIAEEWLWKNGQKQKENGHVGNSRSKPRVSGKRKAVRRANKPKR